MLGNRVSRRIVAVFALILEISATKHWIVTENGKIQPQHDSVFDMRRPYDLLAFLEQEKRRETANAIYKRISRKEVSIDNQFADLGVADTESANLDCFLWDKSLADIDVHASIMIDLKHRDGISKKDYMLYNKGANGKQTEPNCEKTFPLEFSVFTFDHLKAMQNRQNLTQREEPSLMKYLPPNTDLYQFGDQLAHSLSRNRTSWIYLNLASLYWRIKGNAYNALECSRRAIERAPKQYRDIPLLTTAGIFHAARYSGEAAIVLHTAIDYNPLESYHHLALGHIYTSLGDFDRSAACYDNCLKLAPETAEARQMKYAILCHRLLETTLLRLRDVLSEIHSYHDWKEEWLKLYEHMLWEQNVKSTTREIKLAFAREQNLDLLAVNPIEKSINHHLGDNVILSYMDLGDRKKVAENMLQHVHLSLHILKNLQQPVKERNHIAQDMLMELNVEHTHAFAAPTKSPKYHNVEIKKGNEDFEADHWPRISDCDGSMLMFGDGKQYLPVYLSPENKGYAIHLFVNELIDIEPGKKHPLPWHPPLCQAPGSFDERYMTRALLDATARQHTPDASLNPFLHSLVQSADSAEIGQRILTAIEAKIAPWVLSVLASLHWRTVGKPRFALDCLQLALDGVPEEFRDVPLVSIASIHHKVGSIDDALRITREALRVNVAEPMTNLLFGILLNVKGNHTGAMHYLKQALRVDLHLYDGKALMMLKTLACREKFDVITGDHAGCEKRGINLRKRSVSLPTVLLTKYNLQASDAPSTRQRQVKNCKRPHCRKPEVTGTNCWSERRLELADNLPRYKRENTRQGLIQSLLLPNSATELHEPRVDAGKVPNSVFRMNLLTNQYEVARANNFYTFLPKDTPHSYADWPFGKMSDNQKESYYPSKDECDELKHEDWAASLFVFHKFIRRNVTIEDELESLGDDVPALQPTCDKGSSEMSRITEVVQFSQSLRRKAELDVAEWLMMITGTQTDTLQGLGTKIAFALRKHYASWTLAIAASFYWRVAGDSRKALDCVWQGLENTPKDTQDILLLSLASLLSSQNYFHEALEVAQIALSIGPDFIVNHYVLANLHAALGDFETAASFYRSSLELDPNFEPAITRLQVILCFLLFDDKRSAMSEILRNIL
ncbi:PREDICTED: tetratricopeptide repeat protein 17 isoform X2 [Dinoponera quadriceps]|uniref:Tetratricopeptide repeat protein 17 isoform X2 n=1 Tax=Dinoponera quadriceps TaxID=609295 RepID=A0A6P3WUP3_DINQU|nr:PREDICTED: tetratricopeptide repeat protein 17 isoform X2 [Dinoponera quadriceps]